MGRIRFVFGRAGSGKTQYCLSRIARELRRSPLEGSAVVLLVPEQATYQMERALAQRCGGRGYVRARVVSFGRLAGLAADAVTWPTHRTMSATSRLMVMRRAMGRVRGRLRHWQTCQPREMAGPMLRMLDDLSRAGLGVDRLGSLRDSFAGSRPEDRVLADKLHDLAAVAEAYGHVDADDLADPLDEWGRFQERIGRLDLLRDATVYVDGFAGFSGQEYAALAGLGVLCRTMTVTLCLNPAGLADPAGVAEWDCFATVRHTHERLVRLAAAHGIAVGEPIVLGHADRRRFASNRSLAALERAMSQGPEAGGGGETIDLVVAADRRSEVTTAAGKILELIRERHWRYRDISVVVRELADYDGIIRDVFDEAGIAYFLDSRRPISRSPLAALICGAVGAVVHDYQTSWVLRYLKSGLASIDPDRAAEMENYVLAHGIDGGRWLTTWRYGPALMGAEDSDRGHEPFDLAALNALREEAVGPLRRLASALSYDPRGHGQYTIETVLSAVIAFLGDLGVAGRLQARCERASAAGQDVSAQTHRQVWKVVNEMFVQMRLSWAGQDMSLGEFLRVIEDAFNEQTVGVVPSCLDQVLVGEIERSRHPSVRATFVLGFNEGQFPTPAADDVILTDVERAALGCEDLARPADVEAHYAREQYLAYIALTRASAYLWISYAERDRQGRRQYPSRWLARLEPIVGEAEERSASLATGVIDEASLAVGLIKAVDGGIDEEKEAFWTTVANGLLRRAGGRERLGAYVQAWRDRNRAELTEELAGSLYGSRLNFSQLETYYRCPFQHFCRYGLRLSPRAVYRLEPVDLGQFRHQVMRIVWERVRESDTLGADPDFPAGAVNEAIERCLQSMHNPVILSNPRNRYILECVREELALAFAWQLRTCRMGKLRAARLEESFACSIGERFELVGRIDREDRGQVGDTTWAAIFDYKSGATSFDFTGWYAGVQLQLPGYMWAVVGAEGSDRMAPAAAMFLPLVPSRRGPVDAAEPASLFQGSGLVNREAIDVLIDREQSTGREFQFQIRKDGTPGNVQHGSLVESNVFGAILRHTEKLIWAGADGIASGCIVVHPYRKNRSSVCSHCDFRTVCRFDPFVNAYRTISGMKKLDVLARLTCDDT